jgi:hypothetical protein
MRCGAGAGYLLCHPESDYVSGQVVMLGRLQNPEGTQPAATPNPVTARR